MEERILDMTLNIRNIGKLAVADVKLGGITVIAGENNSGKSTVGKVLFSVINGLCYDDSQVELDKQRELSRLLYSFCNNESMSIPSYIITPLLNELFEDEELAGSVEYLTEWVSKSHLLKTLDEKDINDLANEMHEIMSVPDNMVLKRFIENKLRDEFNGQLENMHSPDNSSKIALSNDNITIELVIKEGEIFNNPEFASFNKEAFYIDNPFILDKRMLRPRVLRNGFLPIHRQSSNRQSHLLRCIDDSMESETNPLGDILKEKKLSRAFEIINRVCSGSLKSAKRGSYVYSEGDASYNIGNVSTGLKTFIIIKTLIMNNCLKSGDILILDEPEIHLHPEWQIALAELIVLIQKDFNVVMLINTHSLYFLRAVEVYAIKHCIEKKCKYYQCDVNAATINDVTDKIDEIYKTMAYPLQLLKNEEYANEY
ncbi:MAG: ATP-binding protein [Defluviitaleaceae bacterium]|nr:ATP-binding protein [Defluviitaleaceae bacterium]